MPQLEWNQAYKDIKISVLAKKFIGLISLSGPDMLCDIEVSEMCNGYPMRNFVSRTLDVPSCWTSFPEIQNENT